MPPKLTPEMREALAAHQGQPIEIQDDQTQRVYILVARDQAREQLDQWVMRQLLAAESDISEGRVVPWNKEQVLAQAGLRPTTAD